VGRRRRCASVSHRLTIVVGVGRRLGRLQLRVARFGRGLLAGVVSMLAHCAVPLDLR
jgi:hypothetical protein